MTLGGFPGGIYGGIGQLGARAQAAAAPWYLQGGIAAGNCIAAYKPKGATSQAAALVNLANPGTYNAISGTKAPTWAAATGWSFNEGDGQQYIRTGIIFPDANHSVIVRFEMNTAYTFTYRMAFGSYTAPAFWFAPQWGSKRTYQSVGVASSPGNIINTSGARVACLSDYAYLDGVQDGATQFTGDATTKEIYLGAVNNNGPAAASLGGYIHAAAIYSIKITAAQVAAVTAAMAAL